MPDSEEEHALTVEPGHSVGFLLSQLGFVTARGFKKALKPVGLEPGQFALLNFVDAARGRSQQALGEALQIPASRMVALLDRLEERGLLERRRSPEDRRVHPLFLTPAGRRLLTRARKIAMNHEANISAPLKPKEREQLLALLARIAAKQGVAFGVHPGLTEPEED